VADPKIVSTLKLVGMVGVAGALVAAVALPFVGGAGVVARTVADDFNNQQCGSDVLSAQVAQKTIIYAANNQPITQLYRQNRDIAKAEEIPQVLRDAIVSIEDRRFYEHHGVDVKGLLRATIRTSSGDTQGASTLTQQYVKQLNLYSAKTQADQTAATEQTAGRKLKEARCALELEKTHTKQQILTGYLNIANFGAGAYGVKIAALTYFPKTPLSKLTPAQAALLAGLVQSPTRYNPYQHPEAAKARRHDVLQALVRDGKITAAVAKKADAEKVPSGKPPAIRQQGCGQAGGGVALNLGYFCDYVVDFVKNKLGLTEDQLFTGGYKIYTTIDPEMQRVVQQSAYDHMGTAPQSVGVMDVVEPATGKVKAIGVSRRYGTGPGQTTVPLGTKAVAGAGSTYKVFTLLAAMKEQVPLRAYKISTPNNTYKTVNCPQHNTVENAGHYADSLDMETATYQSSNTFFTALIDQRFKCDLTKPVNMALALGMDSYKPYASKTIAEQQVSFTLGPNPTSPLEMASAYGTMANNGSHCPATPIAKILDSAGRPAAGLKALPACQQVFSAGIAHTATRVLQKDTSAENGATASAAQISGYATAGKTGTNGGGTDGNDGNASMWFIGFTPNLSASVAVFNPKSTSSPVRDIPGYEGQNLFGGRAAAPIWKQAMQEIMQRYDKTPWPEEDKDVVKGDAVPVQTVIGMPKDQAVATLEGQGFSVEFGDPVDSTVPKDSVADQSPQGYAEKNGVIVLKLSTGKAPVCVPAPGKPCGPGGPGTPGNPGTPGGPGNGGGGRGGGGRGGTPPIIPPVGHG
jgi:membrane peptidoglycan carboxypeptidase